MKATVSANFKKYAKKTIVSIAVFAVTYLFLLFFAVGVTFLFGWLGIQLFLLYPSFYTGIACLGLMATGLTVLFFLIKFVFASNKIDTSHLTEITQEEEPALFATIYYVARTVETNLPKRVFLSSDVNAAVFYNSNFWSMFLPVPKNLQIGVGLINSTTQQELIAILAHEFGHFSQRSMKVGTYVYQANQVIYNMLYRNESLDNTFQSWANATGYAAPFIAISIFIIKQIQRILKKLYTYLNLNYMALSREMEFHADEIAAHVAGSQALADSLLRINFASSALESVLAFYDQKTKENIKSENIYPEHQFVMNTFAERHQYLIENGLPKIDLTTIRKYNKSKLNLENQWASHPSDEERIHALSKLNISKDKVASDHAILLLSQDAQITKAISDKLFSTITYESTPSALSLSLFKESFTAEFRKHQFDPMFNDFYDNNEPILTDLADNNEKEIDLTFEDLFSNQKMDMLYTYASAQSDKFMVEAIVEGNIDLKTFDYDGIKYNKKDAPQVLEQINHEVTTLQDQIKESNKQVYSYFLNLATHQNRKDEFLRHYQEYATAHEKHQEQLRLHNQLCEGTQFIFVTTPFEEISDKLKALQEPVSLLRKKLTHVLEQPDLRLQFSAEALPSIQKFIDNELVYFEANEYISENLEVLFTNINEYRVIIDNTYFTSKKNYLQSLIKLEKNIDMLSTVS